jgi:hypothetical protein
MMKRRAVRAFSIAAVVILSVVLIAGCSRVTGGSSSPGSCAECSQLLTQYPWLEQLGLGTLWYLVQTYGPDIANLLMAAIGLL